MDVRRRAAAAGLEAVAVGKHHVEHDEVGPERRGLPERLGAVARDLHVEPFVPQGGGDEVGDVRFVVDDQDAFGVAHAGIVARMPVEMLCDP